MSRGEMRAGSRLEHVLRSGRFAVTAELTPPDTADPHEVYDRALLLASVCDAINATDASGAHVHMSSVGVCSLLTQAGYEPVLQMSCQKFENTRELAPPSSTLTWDPWLQAT